MLHKLSKTLDPGELANMRLMAEECSVAISLMKQRDAYPDGSQHMCECFESHMSLSDGGDDEPMFIAMEFCGEDISAYMDRLGLKDNRDFLRQAMQALFKAIEFMQRTDPPRIHHDIKPPNLVVNASGVVKVIDYGAMMLLTEVQKEGMTCDPCYASPEVYCAPDPPRHPPNFDVNRPAAYDTWSAGLTYWELLCHEDPRGKVLPADRHCLEHNTVGVDLCIIKDLLETDPKMRMLPARAIEYLDPSNISAMPPCDAIATTTATATTTPTATATATTSNWGALGVVLVVLAVLGLLVLALACWLKKREIGKSAPNDLQAQRDLELSQASSERGPLAKPREA